MRLKLLYRSGWILTRCISKLGFGIKISGGDRVPRTGGFIAASNHISYYDPPLIGSWAPREMCFFAKKELFRNPVMGAIIRATNAIPVGRGTVDRKAMEAAVNVIQSGFGLLVFPEGTRSRTDKFLPPRPGVGMIAVKAGCPIVPVYLHGSNHSSDCFRRRDQLSITFGEPLSAEWVRSFSAEKASYVEIAAAVMDCIAALKKQVTSS